MRGRKARGGWGRWLGAAWLAWLLGVGNAHAQTRVLYETGFEQGQGFDPSLTLVGQDGWVGQGTGGNGLVSDFFPGQGQHAFIGFGAPVDPEEFLSVWRPVNFQPGGTNATVVRFSVLMSVEDSSSTTNRDDFRWSVYNVAEQRLFSLDFDNDALGVNYVLDDDRFVSTGVTFTNAHAYQLEVVMDFRANRWTATLDGVALATALPLTTRGAELTFGDMDAVWAIRQPGRPGDNYLVFDNYRLTAETGGGPPPRLEALGMLRPGEFLLRCHGTAGRTYVLEGSADLLAWRGLKTNAMPADGHFDHLDQAALPSRLYRLFEP